MGQAKLRGTKEERVKEALLRKEQEKAEHERWLEERRQRDAERLAAMTPEERKIEEGRRRRSNEILGLMIMLGQRGWMR